MSRPQGHVLLLGKIHEDAMQLLRSHQELTYEVLDHSSDNELPIKLQQADALIVRTAKLSPEILKRLLSSGWLPVMESVMTMFQWMSYRKIKLH